MLYNSIQLVDKDIQKDMYANIVLSGGNTCFENFETRLEKEMKSLAPDKTKVHALTSWNKKYSAWHGASIFASKSEFPKLCITKAEYEETGPAIVHKKCL